MNRKLITIFDIFLIGIFIVLSISVMFVFLSSDIGNKVVISVDEKLIGEYSLNSDLTKEIKSEYGDNTVTILNGECFVVDADCRDRICINRGKISKIGESIVCLPHKLIVEIK